MLREEGDLPDEVEVLVLGAGMAGHCTALAAADAGIDTLLLEKAALAGGSSAMAGGMFAFSGTDLQIEAGVDDSLAAFRADLVESGQGKNDPRLIDLFLRHQLDAYRFLSGHGVRFSFHQAPPPFPGRLHATGTGRAISNLHMAVRAHPGIRFFSHAAGVRLERNEHRVTGAHIRFGDREAYVRSARGVVLATGGFSRSAELLQTFAPEFSDAIAHGGVANTGDGLLMAGALGAGLADLGYVSASFGGGMRNHSAQARDLSETPPLLLAFQDGAVLVNKLGRRFLNESQSYKKISTAVLAQPDKMAFQLFDAKLMACSLADTSVNNYREAQIAGYVIEAPDLTALAQAIDVEPGALLTAVARYNAQALKGVDGDFGRIDGLRPIDEPPFYIAPTGNAVTSTYGGLTVDETLTVTNWLGERIDGLFAAGEVIGGFHGGGYYSASSLASAATFGMYLGRSLAMAGPV